MNKVTSDEIYDTFDNKVPWPVASWLLSDAAKNMEAEELRYLLKVFRAVHRNGKQNLYENLSIWLTEQEDRYKNETQKGDDTYKKWAWGYWNSISDVRVHLHWEVSKCSLSKTN